MSGRNVPLKKMKIDNSFEKIHNLIKKEKTRDFLILLLGIYFTFCAVVIGDCILPAFSGLVGRYTRMIFCLMLASSIMFFCIVKIETLKNIYKPLMAAARILFQLIIILMLAWMLEIPVGHKVEDIAAIYKVDYIALLILIWIFVFVLTNHTKAANIILLTTACIYGQVNALVYNIRQVPIQPQDYASLSAAANVSSGYELTMTHDMRHQLKLYIMIMFFLILLYDEKIKKKRVGLCILAGYLFFLIVFGIVFIKTDFVYNQMKLEVNTYDIKRYYAEEGYLPAFIADIKELVIEKPDGYNRKDVEELLLGFAEENGESDDKPNIIVVMNESFSDLSVINDFDTNVDYMPYWYSLKENTIRGNLYVSAKGGSTVNTEFEFLTGNSVAFLSNTGYTYIDHKTQSLVSTMQAQGYKAIGMHPFPASGYRRGNIYNKMLGFDETYFEENMNLEESDYIKPERVSDESDYKRLIEQYENAGDTPVFIFNITMQNHGGYNYGMDSVRVQNIDVDVPLANEFLSLMQISDQAFEKLINYFEKQDEKTIVVMFGDHQPAVEDEFFEYLYGNDMENLSLDEVQKQYEVPFLIWANYDIEEEEGLVMSPNFLSSYLLDVAGLNMTSYNRYLLELHNSIQAINVNGYMGSDGRFYDFDEDSEYTDLIDEYRAVEYYNMFDGDRDSTYFEP